MSTRHLSTGSELPAKILDKWRLYSMEYCPYAQRARLILDLKKVDYEIVNCNLINKPEWLFTVHPEGKVPALDTGTQVIVESLDICDFVNDAYPNPPLYSIDPAVKERQKSLIDNFGDLITIFSQIVLQKESKTPAEWLADIRPHLNVYELALTESGKYFGGEVPCMADYMLWPWAERAGAIPLTLGDTLPVDDEEYPRLKAWKKAMRSRPEVGNIYHGSDKFMQVVAFKTLGTTPDYDNIK